VLRSGLRSALMLALSSGGPGRAVEPHEPGPAVQAHQLGLFNLCFSITCPQAYEAAVLEASFVASDPGELGGAAKWRYRFAVSATP